MKPDKKRCGWVENTYDLYYEYHDTSWGVPVHDDREHFEFLVLEGAQAGLSWSTVLKKRENYRRLFANFDPAVVAGFDEKKQLELLSDPGIIRNKLKVASAITNAQAFCRIQEQHGSFDHFIWRYMDGKPLINHWKRLSEVPASTKVSDRISKDLKKMGFKFVGSTIIYAYMQAVGMVMDHTTDCFRHDELVNKLDK